MKIVVAVRCLNEANNIDRFMRGYDFADTIVVSDGGSTDGSLEMLKKYPKVQLLNFEQGKTVDGHYFNEDAPHMNFVLNAAKALDPTWLIFDDMDDVPNRLLRENARTLLEGSPKPQVNAFRLYLWGEEQHFIQMSRNYHPDYKSLWAWKPKEIEIHADENIRHGTIVGITPDHYGLDIPYCLLHKSWSPETITKKMEHYKAMDLPFNHPLEWAGALEKLPDWAYE